MGFLLRRAGELLKSHVYQGKKTRGTGRREGAVVKRRESRDGCVTKRCINFCLNRACKCGERHGRERKNRPLCRRLRYSFEN